MKARTLLGQLLVWQLVVTGVACVVLVGSTVVSGWWIIRHGQDRSLESLVEAIARRHGGSVDAGESELGGERVRIRIPLLAPG